MNELHWTELAAHAVAWHNRHPLARHIGVQHVHSLGYVMLPFADAAAGTATAPTARATPGGSEPLPPEATAGGLRERAMARAQLEAQGAAAMPDDSPPSPAAPAQLRPAFDEDFFPPHPLKAVRRWAARQAVAQNTPRGDVQVRKVKAEAGLPDSAQLPRWALTAQIEVGRARTRVLVGPGLKPAVLGRRLISPVRTLALFALVGLAAGAAVWVMDREPTEHAATPARAASAALSARSATSAASATPAAPAASIPVAPDTGAAGAASAAAPTLQTPPETAAASAPVDVEPQLGQIDLPSLGPRIEARRRRTQEAAAVAASAPTSAPPSTPTPAHTAATSGTHSTQPRVAAPAPGTPSFAVTTRLLRTRSESEQLAAAIRELLSKQPGPPVHVDVLAAGDDWRVVGWPYTDRAVAEQARALLAARGMKVQVVDF